MCERKKQIRKVLGMRWKKGLAIIMSVLCCFGMGNQISAAENSNDDFEYSPVILEEGFTEEWVEDPGISPFAVKTAVNWTVKPKILKKSGGFKKRAGDTIVVNIRVKSQKKVLIGIIKGNTQKTYQSTTTGVYKTFKIKETDTYHVFVQNFSSSSVQVTGYYRK